MLGLPLGVTNYDGRVWRKGAGKRGLARVLFAKPTIAPTLSPSVCVAGGGGGGAWTLISSFSG